MDKKEKNKKQKTKTQKIEIFLMQNGGQGRKWRSLLLAILQKSVE
jgi:hypothetical protein